MPFRLWPLLQENAENNGCRGSGSGYFFCYFHREASSASISFLSGMTRRAPFRVVIRDAGLYDPSLTTAKIPGGEIGRIAVSVLLKRISEPDLPYLRVSIKTTPVFGGSTR